MPLDKPLGGGYKRRMNFKDRASVFLATGLSIGRIPIAPGTFGTLLAIPICFGLAELGAAGSIAGVVGFVLVAARLAGRAEKLIGKKDPSVIVIDEVAGMMVTLTGLPLTPFNLAVGFLAFRALDILKPFPAGRIDRHMGGGWGIVMDDVVAGVYSHIFLRIISLFFFQGAAA